MSSSENANATRAPPRAGLVELPVREDGKVFYNGAWRDAPRPLPIGGRQVEPLGTATRPPSREEVQAWLADRDRQRAHERYLARLSLAAQLRVHRQNNQAAYSIYEADADLREQPRPALVSRRAYVVPARQARAAPRPSAHSSLFSRVQHLAGRASRNISRMSSRKTKKRLF